MEDSTNSPNQQNLETALWVLNGRPCRVTLQAQVSSWVGPGVKRQHTRLHLRFLDGKDPKFGTCNGGEFKSKARRIIGLREKVLRRADDLAEDGMDHARAMKQAMDEMNDKILF